MFKQESDKQQVIVVNLVFKIKLKMIKKAYYYFYYKLYKLFQVNERDWLSEFKASLSIDVLFFCLLFSIIMYYNIFINRYFSLDIPNIKLKAGTLYILFILIPNYFIFHHKDQWKAIVKEFEQLPKKKNRLGDWIIYSIVILIIANLIFAFYLMSQVDWKQYR
jgi:hypothetical protein